MVSEESAFPFPNLKRRPRAPFIDAASPRHEWEAPTQTKKPNGKQHRLPLSLVFFFRFRTVC
jgi:hypothetical protein